MHKQLLLYRTVLLLLFFSPMIACKKLVSVPDPRNTINDGQIFENDIQAETTLGGLYSLMINGDENNWVHTMADKGWAAGLLTVSTSLSAGDFYNTNGVLNQRYYVLSVNRLTLFSNAASTDIWKSAYKSIYIANYIVEGIATSTSPALTEKARKEFTAEAKFVRALAFFYLTNLFGDVPLALTIDFNKTQSMPRTPQQKVYEQILADLRDARAGLPPDYSAGKGERVRPNKWAATALLARVYLYLKDFPKAAEMASEVIGQPLLYQLATDLAKTFQSNSTEAIWQLKHTTENSGLGYASPEGFLLNKGNSTITPNFTISNHLLQSFEQGDLRRKFWIDSSDNSSENRPPVKSFFPGKYKIGEGNRYFSQWKEYNLVLRLAEQFLIRAEARANGAAGGLEEAIKDLNVIRDRADLTLLPNDLGKEDVLKAVEMERQHELFAEWGHRWLDLKRTGKAVPEMLNIPYKNPWLGDYQLLYPIPTYETENNIHLSQNTGYIQ